MYFQLQIQHISFTHPRIAQKNTFMKYPHKEDTHSLMDLHSRKSMRPYFKMLHEYHTQTVLKTNCAKSDDVLSKKRKTTWEIFK